MGTLLAVFVKLFDSRKLAMSGVAGALLVVRCFVPELQLLPVEAILTLFGVAVGAHTATDIAAVVVDANRKVTASEILQGGRRGLVAPIEPPGGV